VIASMPTIRKLKQSEQRFDYYEDGPSELLVAAAKAADLHCLPMVLQGGDAGLRGDEIVALKLKHCACTAARRALLSWASARLKNCRGGRRI